MKKLIFKVCNSDNVSQSSDILEIQLFTGTFDKNWNYTIYHWI